MAYTYLISGATSDVGRALIRRLLKDAPEGTLVLAQGCGDVDKLAPLCQEYPGMIRPFDVDLSDPYKVDTFCQLLGTTCLLHSSLVTELREYLGEENVVIR